VLIQAYEGSQNEINTGEVHVKEEGEKQSEKQGRKKGTKPKEKIQRKRKKKPR
jgi:hypothetical protein